MSKKKEKNAFNSGVELGIKVAQPIMEKNLEAMDYLKNKVGLISDGQDEMRAAVDKVIEDANENAIARLFGVCNSFKPSDLEIHEKKVLLNIIASLSANGQNEFQKKYFNNLRHHLDVQGFEPDLNYDFSYVESLESIKAIKTIAKAVRIFLFLKENSMDGIYCHEDDLFSHFEIKSKSFDEIDAVIEILYVIFGEEGLIELYGDFEEEVEEEEPKNTFDYLEVKEAEYIPINLECAQAYFNNCYFYDSNLYCRDASSFIIFNEGNNVMKIDKRTGIKSVLLSGFNNPAEAFRKIQITTCYDMCYFIKNSDLCYIDIESLASGVIFHIDEKMNDKGEVEEIKELSIINNGKKCIFEQGYSLLLVDIKEGFESAKRIHLGSESKNYLTRGDYAYFLDMADVDFSNTDKFGYVIKKYGLVSGNTTVCTDTFFSYDMLKKTFELELVGAFKDHFFVIFKEESSETYEPWGFKGFYFNLTDEDNIKAHKFDIHGSYLYQMEKYGKFLVYIDADNGYAVTTHNILTGERKVLKKGYGETEKASLGDKLLAGKSFYQHPKKYMRLGKWLWFEKDSSYEVVCMF